MASPRALVVDDEPDIRDLLTITLERMGLGVAAVGDTVVGPQAARAASDSTSCSPT